MKYRASQTIESHNQILFDKFRSLNIPVGDYAIVSGGPLAIRGIRKTSDVDVLVNKKLWDKLSKMYPIMFYGGNKAELLTPLEDIDFFSEETLRKIRGNLGPNEPSVESQINNAEIIDGLAFQNLNDCLWFKIHQGRKKDKNDIALVKKYLIEHPEEMIDSKQAIILYKQFASDVLPNEKWYESISQYIKATLLYGSVAKGTNRKDSDIDILIIVPLKIEEKFTKGEYFYTHKGNEINIVLRSIEKLRNIAKEQKDAFQKEVFRNSIIISSSNDEVKDLLRKIEKF